MLKGLSRLLLLMQSLVSKELRVRYKRSVLGFFWFLLKPLFSMVVYTIVFTQIIRFGGAIRHFSLFLLTGLLPWNFFSASLSASTKSLLDNHRLIRSIYFPRVSLPVASVAANAVNLFLSLVVLEAALIAFGHAPGPSLLVLPVILLLFMLMTSGICMMLSVWNIYYRDVSQLMDVLLLAWFYASPVIYPLGRGIVPDKLESVLRLNPLSGLMEMFHSVLHEGVWPDAWCWLSLVVWSLVLFAAGTMVFKRAEPVVVKEL
jgi:ABC-2 type transport system permease protein